MPATRFAKRTLGGFAVAAVIAGATWFAMPREVTYTAFGFNTENARGDRRGTPPLTVAIEEAKRLYPHSARTGDLSGTASSSGELSITVRGRADVEPLADALRRRLGDPVRVTAVRTVTQTSWFCPTC